jgi:hypothetical protein
MIFGYFTLFVALLIEVVGAYYSITGLAAIFSGAVVPILIMGGVLEVGKVTAAVWLKNNWHRASMQFKLYLLPAVVLLMFITSMGIFGFLSKAHNDQNLVSGDVMGKIAIYDEKIKIQKDNIESARRALQQMDAAVDQTMARSTSETGADKATAIRRGQARERTNLQNEISKAQTEIVKLNDQRAPIAAEVRKVEAEVGPIKYIAKLIYGDNPDANLLEHAVVWVIIMIVAVFDPLALVLILAAQQSIRWARGEDAEEPSDADAKPYRFTQFTEKITEKIKRRFIKDDTPDFEGVKLPDGTWVQTGPAFNTAEPQEEYTNIDEVNFKLAKAAKDARADYSEGSLIVEMVDDDYKPFKGQGSGPAMPMIAPYIGGTIKSKRKPRVKKTSQKTEQEIIDEVSILVAEETLQATESPNAPGLDVSAERPGDYVKSNEVKPMVREAAPAPNRGVMYSQPAKADNTTIIGRASHSDFGNVFPSNPEKGDIYLRTDYLPNRLYKFNGNKWIEVDKAQTDVYAYDSMYIKHLIEEIDAGRYDADSLTDVERDQIKEYLKKNVQ